MFQKNTIIVNYDSDSLKRQKTKQKQKQKTAPCDPDCKARIHLFGKLSQVPVPN